MTSRSPLAPRARTKRSGDYHHGDLRRALQSAALAIVGREGTGAVSLRAVARQVGVTPQATYNHFSDKAALLAAAAEEALHELTRCLVAAREGGVTPGAGLEAVGVAYVVFASEHPAHFRLLSAPELSDKRAQARLLAAYDEAFGVLRCALGDCQAAGVVRAGDELKLATAAWAMVHGLAWLVIDKQLGVARGVVEPEAAARDSVRVLFKGLLAPRR